MECTDVEEETVEAPLDSNTSLPIKIFRKTDRASTHEGRPLIVLYFPGGLIIGDPITLAPLARSMVRRLDAVVACPTYRVAPEHPFPAPFLDGWCTLEWLARNSKSIGADPSKGFIVGGSSSGGNIANTVAHLARDRKLDPPLTGVWLSCAGARVKDEYEHLLPQKYRIRHLSRSQDECASNATVSAGMEVFKKSALKPDTNSTLYAPLIWSADEAFGHHSFPKTYSQVAGMDAARDDALIFDDMLRSQGTSALLHLYRGLPHFFYQTLPSIQQSKEWEKRTLQGFEWLLSHDSKSDFVDIVDDETRAAECSSG